MIRPWMTLLMIVLVAVLVWALYELFRCLREAVTLRSGVAKLRRNASNPHPFPDASPLQNRATGIARKMQHPKLAIQTTPERELESLSADFATRLARPKALAGLLIILGLLITLTNLRTAVNEMKGALEPSPLTGGQSLSDQSSAASQKQSPESKVRQGIAGIADAAGTAFGYSTLAIGFAALILILSVFVQRLASLSIQDFAAWMFESHEELLLKQVEQPQDTAAKLELAADNLLKVSAQFQDTTTALAELKTFGTRLDSAAEEISKAVSAIPTHLDNSMTKISSDVAHGIQDGLSHQNEYLKSLVAIYSDHASLVVKTIEFISRIADSNRIASEALATLRTLPEDIRTASVASREVRSAAQALSGIVTDLSAKVEALPSANLAEAASKLSDATATVFMLKDNAEIMLKTASTLRTNVDDAAQRSINEMREAIKKVETKIESALATSSADTVKASSEVRGAVAQLNSAIGRLQGAGRGGELGPLHTQIEVLSKEIDSMPSLQVIRMLRAAGASLRRLWRR